MPLKMKWSIGILKYTITIKCYFIVTHIQYILLFVQKYNTHDWF